MTNKELVNYIVCNNCRVNKQSENKCIDYDKEHCFIYTSALDVANEKDKQLEEEYVQHFDNA